MNVKEKILKMENCRGRNHDLRLFRQWLNEYLPNHVLLTKIQVAGTNGKGSTCQWFSRLLQNAGYNVGMFTSPHLVSHFERISINDQNISSDDWERIYDQYEALFDEKQMTMFEMDLWMAIAYFLEQGVNVAIIEVGMGGRLDATTALDYITTVITNVSMDHQTYLGDSVEQITFEKSGIFKPGVYALTTEKKKESQKVMELIADYLEVPLGFVEMPYSEVDDHFEFEWMGDTYSISLPYYQIDNLALALETLSVNGYPLSKEVVQKTIDEFEWLGRFTVLKEDPKIILDGAHNIDGIETLVRCIDSWKGHIYFSALKEKDVVEMIQILESLNCPITLVTIESERMYPLENLNLEIISMDVLIDRIQNPTEDMLLCGSLYYVGEVLEKLYGKKEEKKS